MAPRPPDGDIDVKNVIPGDGSIEIEIGFGRGMFFLERAQAAPNSRILGLEIRAKWAYWVSKRAAQMGLRNACAWGCDARDVLSRAIPDASVARVFMHFPDPWWKKRHAERRLVGPTLLDAVARLLAPGGEFFVQTDVEERAQIHLAALATHPAFELANGTGLLEENSYGARSNREKRAIADGLPVYRVLAIRTRSPRQEIP